MENVSDSITKHLFNKNKQERILELSNSPFRVVNGVESKIIPSASFEESPHIREKSLDIIIDPILKNDSRLIHDAVNRVALIFNYRKPITYYETSDSMPFTIPPMKTPSVSISDLYHSIFIRRKGYENELLSPAMLNILFPNSHCPVLLTKEKIFPNVGNTIKGASSIISFDWFSDLSVSIQEEVKKTAIYHELGHVFGLITEKRGDANIDHFLGDHCKTDGCSMRQGNDISAWENTTRIGLKNNSIYCEECLEDIKELIPGSTNLIIERSIHNRRTGMN
jgi:hypothetical protein